MIVKFIKDLIDEDLERLHNSTLWGLICSSPQYLPIHNEYYKAYFGEHYKDYSLVAFDKKDFYIGFICFTNDSTHSLFGEPIEIFDINCDETTLGVAYNEFYAKLERIATDGGASKIVYSEHDRTVARFFEKMTEQPKIKFEAYINLALPIDNIKMNVRKSYKSLVNWGCKNLDINIYDLNNITNEIFEEFHQFHVQVSGRITRSDRTWELQCQAIKDGKATYVSGRLSGELVAGVFTTYGNTIAYYGVAVNNRELMAQNMPLGHVVLLESIIKAKNDGIEIFILGDVTPADDEKNNAITKYKRGFTNTIRDRRSYAIDLK